MLKKKIAQAAACFALTAALIGAAGTVPAQALSTESLSAPGVILVEAETGETLFEKNPHEIRACASITKVMTLLLVMEELDKGNITLEQKVTASAHAASMGGSDIWLEEGETMTVDDMIKATAVASANDAAVALAELVSGSEEDFVDRMNQRAAELGMNDTVFKNCNGLDEEGHLTSAYDVALMSRELIKHEKIFDYTSIWLDYLRGGETQIVNTNKLLKSYNGITGLKTGTTSQAGSCISATAERDGLSLIAVVLGCDSGTARFKDAAALLDYGFSSFEAVTLETPEQLSQPLKVKKGMESEVALECKTGKSLVVPKDSKEKIETKITMQEEIEAPVEKNFKVGTVEYLLDGQKLASFDIVTAEAVGEMSFASVMKLLLSSVLE